MSNQDDALQEIVTIARNNNLTLADITRAMTNAVPQKAKASGSILSRLLGYVGGIFVFAGICIFVGMQWNDMGSAARVVVTLGTGFVAFLMALACLTEEKYERAATPLFLIAALLQPTGIFVMLDEYSSGGNPKHGVLFMATFMLIQQGAMLWSKQRTVLAFTTIFFACVFFATACDLMDIKENLIGLTTGVSLMCVAWSLGHSRHAAITPFWNFVGSVALFVSVFDIVKNSAFEVLYLGLAAFMIYVSTLLRSRALLLTSTVAMLCYISYYTAQNFAGTVGWPICLIILGLALMALAGLALRLNTKYISTMSR